MKYVEFSYNQIESRMKIEKRDFFMYVLRCLNGNSFTSRERLQPIHILRNVSLKKKKNSPSQKSSYSSKNLFKNLEKFVLFNSRKVRPLWSFFASSLRKLCFCEKNRDITARIFGIV